jgi:hypothetical protein
VVNDDEALSGDGQLIQQRPARDEPPCRHTATGAQQDCVTAAARARLVGVVARLSNRVTDSCCRLGSRRHVGSDCRPGAQHRDCGAGDHSSCLSATAAKASEMPDVADHEIFPCARGFVTDL